MNFNLLREGYTPERGAIFYDQIVERASGLPGVQGAAIAQAPPLAGRIPAQRVSRREPTRPRPGASSSR